MRKSYDDYTKEDWLVARTHGSIKADTVIHRVFRVDYLLSDLRRGVNTLVHPCYQTQHDDLENPLKGAEFEFEGARHQIFLSIMAEYYAQSWSLIKQPWGKFGEGEDTVRVTSTVGKIFSRLMDENDPFYSLHYHVGLIEYEGDHDIKSRIASSGFEEFLDSQGYGLLKTVLRIRADFRQEREVRFVYIRSPREGHAYPLRNQVFGDQLQFCAHSFDWQGAIDDFEFAPTNNSQHKDLCIRLQGLK